MATVQADTLDPRVTHVWSALAVALVVFIMLIQLPGVSNAPGFGTQGLTVFQAFEQTEQRIIESFEDLPLSFIPNEGQADPRVLFSAQGPGYSFSFTDEGVVMALASGRPGPAKDGVALNLEFVGAAAAASPTADLPHVATIDYLKGRDASEWITDVPTYGRMVYAELWPGIDARFRGRSGELKYEFAVSPGASIADIGLRYGGAESLSLSPSGSLQIHTAQGVLTDARPVSYQVIGGRRVPVESSFFLGRGGTYGFEVEGDYDPRHPLLIDPGLAYSSYLGGPGFSNFFCECGRGIAVDDDGHVFVSGQALDAFPTTEGAFQETYQSAGHGSSGVDAFVAEFDPAASGGDSLLYATYIGGSNTDAGPSVAVRDDGHVFVGVGTHSDEDFPVTAGALQPTYGGGVFDAAVVELDLSATGADALVYSTYLGGPKFDGGPLVTLGADGNVFVRMPFTNSKNLPTTPGAFQSALAGGDDAYLAELDTSESGSDSLVYATYLGGSGDEFRGGIAVDGNGHILVSGSTDSFDFPVTSAAFQGTFGGGSRDAFVAALDPDLTGSAALLYSTYLGGSGADLQRQGIGVDAAGGVIISGDTSSINFPVTPTAYQATYGGGSFDSFVARLDPSASGAPSLTYATYLGGNASDTGEWAAVDGDGHAWVTGVTSSMNFPVTADAFQGTYGGGSRDAFVAELDPGAPGTASLLDSSYLGGSSADRGLAIAADLIGQAYVAGDTGSTNFPVTAGAVQSAFGGGNGDAFVAVFAANSR